jgi:prepilin-type processing-associated H-X9-DG protein
VPFLMPFLELDTLQQRYTMNRDWQDPANVAPNTYQIKMLLCPSAPQGRTGAVGRGITDYAPPNQLGRPNPFYTANLLPPSDPTYVGILGHNVKRQVTEIRDGTSNTMLMAEDAGRNQWWVMNVNVGPAPPNRGKLGESGAWANPGSAITVWGFNPTAFASGAAATPGDCAVNCSNGGEIYSFHLGVANVVMGDGSVRSLAARTSVNVVIPLATRARNELIPSTAFDY